MTMDFVKQQLETVVQRIPCIEWDGSNINTSKITKEACRQILVSPKACAALAEVGVDVISLVDNMDQLFEDSCVPGEACLKFEAFTDTILRLRGNNNATVKDCVDLRKFIKKQTDFSSASAPAFRRQRAATELDASEDWDSMGSPDSKVSARPSMDSVSEEPMLCERCTADQQLARVEKVPTEPELPQRIPP